MKIPVKRPMFDICAFTRREGRGLESQPPDRIRPLLPLPGLPSDYAAAGTSVRLCRCPRGPQSSRSRAAARGARRAHPPARRPRPPPRQRPGDTKRELCHADDTNWEPRYEIPILLQNGRAPPTCSSRGSCHRQGLLTCGVTVNVPVVISITCPNPQGWAESADPGPRVAHGIRCVAERLVVPAGLQRLSMARPQSPLRSMPEIKACSGRWRR